MPVPGNELRFGKEPRQRSGDGKPIGRVKRSIGERKADDQRRAVAGYALCEKPAQATGATARQHARIDTLDLEPEFQRAAAVTEHNGFTLFCRECWREFHEPKR